MSYVVYMALPKWLWDQGVRKLYGTRSIRLNYHCLYDLSVLEGVSSTNGIFW